MFDFIENEEESFVFARRLVGAHMYLWSYM
jgi:hypothetical protein